ncbi:glycoside hydrolase superfamily [Xylaria sp. CBS 124048]|nr:glycoside hydrolase superfamily [Xylaria sp. CBS 124048]
MASAGPLYSFEAPLGNPSYSDHDNLPPSSRQRPGVSRPSYDPRPPRPLLEDEPPSPYRDNSYPLRSASPNSARRPSRQSRAQAGNSQGVIGSFAAGQPIPPRHRDTVDRSREHEAYHNSSTAVGADNFSEVAAGGIPGFAMSAAEQNGRETGPEVLARPTLPYQGPRPHSQPYPQPQPPPRNTSYLEPQPRARNRLSAPGPYPNGRGAAPYLAPPPGGPTPRRVNSVYGDPFGDLQMAYGQRIDPALGQVNPNDIDDDGDDGLEYGRSARNSMLSLGNSSSRGGNTASTAALGATAAATAGGVLSGIIGRNRNSAVNYDPVQNSSATQQVGGDAPEFDLGPRAEKSDWMAKQSSSKKKWRWILAIIILLIVAGAIVGGVVGSIFAKKGHKSSSGGQSASDDTAQNGDLNINSAEIKALLNNPNLHKVFPGVDYTPISVQYPGCLTNPPSQNNVTRDVAVLSQLTNTIRLYGTDCNQTEMTLHAIKQLQMEDTIKVWLGVWQDTNKTTNARQLDQMWRILDQWGDQPFKGLIIGNEILFRKDMTTAELGDLLDSVRSNLTAHNWTLPVATSDLGDNWTADLAQISDYIMGNVHPFFAGQDSHQAASWTYSFWHNKAGTFFKSDAEKNVISEIGWPTQGGTDCGGAPSCAVGAVAGLDGLNELLSTWVCQALQNGTNYFWFEMFDEPWKISFDTPGMDWEDHWGILDVNRKLKPGVNIPDCGGTTV